MPTLHKIRLGLATALCSIPALLVSAPASAESMSNRGLWDRQPRYEPSRDDADDQDQFERPAYERRRYERDDEDRTPYRMRRVGPRVYNYEGDDFSDRYDSEGDRDSSREERYDGNDQRQQRPPAAQGAPDDQQRITFDGGPRPSISPLAPPKVRFASSYEVGSVVIDTSRRALYYVTAPTQAYQYPISVGKEGFSWTGTEAVSRVAEWPDWYPPAEMRERRPELPEKMTGGLRNPLGATAIYLGNTLYRIHGTNDPKSIGRAESSGCIRMLNQHAVHLASLVHVGTKVTVVPSLGKNVVAAQ
jgi:lipoprotein-anchoring transpeptidase ErfK/SrfK